MALDFAEVPFAMPNERADRAEAAMHDLLEPGDQELARRILGVLGTYYLIGMPDREKIRMVLRVLSYCSAVAIAANGGRAQAARTGFVNALDRAVRRILNI